MSEKLGTVNWRKGRALSIDQLWVNSVKAACHWRHCLIRFDSEPHWLRVAVHLDGVDIDRIRDEQKNKERNARILKVDTTACKTNVKAPCFRFRFHLRIPACYTLLRGESMKREKYHDTNFIKWKIWKPIELWSFGAFGPVELTCRVLIDRSLICFRAPLRLLTCSLAYSFGIGIGI